MAIIYRKTRQKLLEKNKNLYALRKDKVVGTATIEKIRHDKGDIDTRSINSLCQYLNCQPGDLMEYVPDDVDK